jgi:nucleotide-binding universal stress UspA family protein
MSNNNTPVVVDIDGGPEALNAARWAAAVADRLDTSLHIVHGKPIYGYNLTDAAAALRAAMIVHEHEFASAYLHLAADAVKADYPALVVATEASDAPADEALIQLSVHARMIVVGGSQVTPAGALLVGSTTLTVATHSACPVVVWRGTATAPTDAPIVVGVDGTHSARVALDSAFDFADRFGAKLFAVRSWSTRRPLAVTIPTLIDWDALEAVEWAQLTDVVDRCNQSHPDVYASCFLEPTRPAVALLQHAADAQLIVVGNRGRGALSSMLLGSTTLHLLHHSPVPVMICRAQA